MSSFKMLQNNRKLALHSNLQSKTNKVSIPVSLQQRNTPPQQTTPQQKKVGLGFTVDNEVFVGRIAMLGVASSIAGEVLTSKGPIAQFAAETSFTPEQVQLLVLGIAAFNLVNGLSPWSLTYQEEQQNETNKRPDGPIQNPTITMLDKRFYGISGKFGFTRENELFVGRLAQVGFASALIFESITGQGPLTYFDMKTGIPVFDTEFLLFASIMFSLFGAIGAKK